MFMTRRAMLGASAAGIALAAAGCNRTPAGERLHAILDQLSIDILREVPEYATSLAVSEEQAGGRYIDRLSDSSRAGMQRMMGIAETAVRDLGRIRRNQLEGQDVVTHDVVTTSLQHNIETGRYQVGSGATAPYVVTQLSGAYTNLPDFLASQHPVTNRDQADAYIARLSAYARVLDQETERLGLDAADGVIQPDFTIDGAVNQQRTFIANPAAANVLVQALQGKLAQVGEIADADKTALAERARQIVQDEIYPAYQRQIDALEAMRPRATHDAGIWRLPDGEAMYAAALRSWTTTDMSPDDIHNMGVELVREFNSEMDAIFRANGMTRGTVNERIAELSRRPDQIYPSTDAGRTRLLADLNAQMAAINARMPEVCGVQARAALDIRRVPDFVEAGAPGGYYQPAALDGSRPGAYYINLRDPAREWPKFTLPTLTYHEGSPGHHWQISIQQEAGEMPFIRRALMFFSGYTEGWGLYAEQLADEMGMYADNPWGRIGYLQSMTFRASRLVVDTGIHSKRWSREQAIQSMMDATGDQQTTITTEIERYCVWPGQACSYMVGRQALNRSRDAARQTLGEQFDLRAFHDVVLTNGATPLSVTDRLVQEWVASVSGPAAG